MTKLVSKIIATRVRVPQQPNQNNFDYCAIECEYKEMVFADPSSDDRYKNDQSSFLFIKAIPSDVITFELFKNGNSVAQLDDDTYGIYYPSFTNQPLQTGFLIDWQSVINEFGFGSYQFKANQNILGNETVFTSRCFDLTFYSDENAHNTIKIETLQNGNIISSPFDYTDIIEGGWYSSYRLDGEFVKDSFELVSDRYNNSDYQSLQIREQVNTVFNLEINSFPSLILNILAYDSVLADDILVTDYNIFNTEVFREVPVRLLNFGDLQLMRKDRLQLINLEFGFKTEDTIKRRF